MSTLSTTNLKNPSAGSNNIVLGTDGATALTTAKVTTLADSAGANTSTPAEIASGRAKAWVNFDGTGTVAIRASYNVSSITDNGTGDYTVNFTTALADANYGVATYAAFSNNSVATANVRGIGNCIKSAGSIRVQVIYYAALDGGATKQDEVEVNVSIHR
jgi:hypothetical protein